MYEYIHQFAQKAKLSIFTSGTALIKNQIVLNFFS